MAKSTDRAVIWRRSGAMLALSGRKVSTCAHANHHAKSRKHVSSSSRQQATRTLKRALDSSWNDSGGDVPPIAASTPLG